MNNLFSIFETSCKYLSKHGLPHAAYASTGSTNDQAKAEAFQTTDALKVYLAAEQTSGRGRGSNEWESPNSSDYFLCTLSFRLPSAAQAVASPIIGLGIYESLLQVFPEGAFSLKAPNDIYLKDKKILGILVESISMGEETRIIIGIGLNVFSHPKNIENSSSLAKYCLVTEKKWEDFLAALIENLKHSARSTTGAHLTTQQREKLLHALNLNPNLIEKFIAISPFGDLATVHQNISWRDL